MLVRKIRLSQVLQSPLLQSHFLSTNHQESSELLSQHGDRRITDLSSPYSSGHFHWICLAKAYSDCSKVITDICLGFRYSTALVTISMECFIIATMWVGTFKEEWQQVSGTDDMTLWWLVTGMACSPSLFSKVSELLSMTCLVRPSQRSSSTVCCWKQARP